MEIWNGNGCNVYKTETHRCTCYIIKSNKSCVLVDTSVKFERVAITNNIRYMGINKIDAIFLTHSHTDHVANAKYLSDRYQCPVYIAQKGIEKVRSGSCVMLQGIRPYSRLIYSLEQKNPFYSFTRFEACTGAKVLNNETVDYYFGKQVKLFETPGHTEDSLSLIVNNTIAIVGDVMVNAFGNIFPPFADDEEVVKISWSKLLDTECELFCPSHGKPLHRDNLIKAYQKIDF